MSKKKGDRRERLGREIFENAGYLVENPNHSRFANKDFFNLFDFMAVRPDRPVAFVQVKSGSAVGIQQFVKDCVDHFPPDHVDIYYLVYHKREGWRLVEIDVEEETYTDVFDGREFDSNMGVALEEYLTDSVQ